MSKASKLSAIIGLLIITVVVVQMGAAVHSVDERYFEAAEAYCEEEMGPDAELVNSQVIGPHGGLHCEDADGELIHLHDVPDSEIYAALPE